MIALLQRVSEARVEVAGVIVARIGLLVPQFTLAADTRKGTRPSFSAAAEPARARLLFDHLVSAAAASHEPVESGSFAAAMQVGLVNDGPVTFWLAN